MLSNQQNSWKCNSRFSRACTNQLLCTTESHSSQVEFYQTWKSRTASCEIMKAEAIGHDDWYVSHKQEKFKHKQEKFKMNEWERKWCLERRPSLGGAVNVWSVMGRVSPAVRWPESCPSLTQEARLFGARTAPLRLSCPLSKVHPPLYDFSGASFNSKTLGSHPLQCNYQILSISMSLQAGIF